MALFAGICAAAFLQDFAYTSKTVLVSRGHRTLAVAADVAAMLASSLYLILTAAVTIRSGLSMATVAAFAAIAVGGAGGTAGGMMAVTWLEKRLDIDRHGAGGTGDAPRNNRAEDDVIVFPRRAVTPVWSRDPSGLFDLTCAMRRRISGAMLAAPQLDHEG